MNKQDVIKKIAENTGVTQKQATEMLDVTLETISNALAEGDKVQFVGFGTFETRKRAERTGLNPQTKEKINIASSTAVAFKVGAKLKEKVNK